MSSYIVENVLITGISGFLGHHFLNVKDNTTQLYGTFHNNPVHFESIKTTQLNIEDCTAFAKLLDDINPSSVIHLAALSNANFCEQNLDACKAINVTAPFHLAGECQKRGIHFTFASTDLVFDGKKAPYKESDSTNGIMAYGKAKAEMEHLLSLVYPTNTAVARLPLMYGWCTNSPNFMTNWLQKLAKGENVHAFTDEYRTSAWAQDVIEGLLLIAKQKAQGIFHLGGTERQSRFEFATMMAEAFGFDKKLIIPSLQKDVTMAAARPSDVSLNSQKAYDLGFSPKTTQEVLNILAKRTVIN